MTTSVVWVVVCSNDFMSTYDASRSEMSFDIPTCSVPLEVLTPSFLYVNSSERFSILLLNVGSTAYAGIVLFDLKNKQLPLTAYVEDDVRNICG